MKYSLRPYQTESIDAAAKAIASGKKNILLIVPTAGGKSWITAGIIQRSVKRHPHKRILVLCHQAHLLVQSEEKIRLLCPDIKTGIYCNGVKRKDTKQQVILASRDSLGRQPTICGEFDGIIADECHLISSDLDDKETMYSRIIKAQNYRWLVGETGSPWRMSGGKIWGKDKFFECVAYNISMETLRKEGFLVPYTFPTVSTKIDTSQIDKSSTGDYVIAQLDKVASAENTIKQCVMEWINLGIHCKVSMFFCVTRAHAQKTAKIVEQMTGLRCAYVDGEITGNERTEILEDLKVGKYQAIASVGCLTTGFDAPIVDCIVMLRPTLSASLFIQISGRALRPYPGKQSCLILDMAGNFDRFGSLETPMVKLPPPSSTDGTSNGGHDITYMECPSCKAVIPSFAKSCRYCLEVLKTEKEEVFTKHKWYAVLSVEVMDHTTTKGEKAKKITYYVNASCHRLSEYFLVNRGGWFRRVYDKRISQIDGRFIRAVRGEIDGKLFKLTDIEYLESKDTNVHTSRLDPAFGWNIRNSRS